MPPPLAYPGDRRRPARPDQLSPPGDWRIWLILAGRGWGKTRALTEWLQEQAWRMPGSRGAIVGATAEDARSVLLEGESGILSVAPDSFRPLVAVNRGLLTYPNGTQARLFSADQPNRLRGPQHHWAIADELAVWRYPAAWDNLLLGLRLGSDPRVAIATTPRPTALLRSLLRDPTVVVTRGTTYDNRANLAPAFFDSIIQRYEGTALGRQELLGDLIDMDAGALFTRGRIDAGRIRPDDAPTYTRIVVAVDPAVGGDAETGIVTAAADAGDHYYVLADDSLHASPDAWARAVVRAYHAHAADRVIGEANQGGELIRLVLATLDPDLPITLVRATRGKITRAEPIAALYEQGKIHHVGGLPLLEDQMIAFAPGMARSPDRVDALVWAITALRESPPPPDESLLAIGVSRWG